MVAANQQISHKLVCLYMLEFCELSKKIYNLLPNSIKCLDVKNVKMCLKSVLLQSCVYDIIY